MANERRPLTEGLKPPVTTDPAAEQAFVFGKSAPKESTPPTPSAPVTAPTGPVARAPLTTRLRADICNALKQASLKRQLAGEEPYQVQEIIEAVLEPWLKNNGYL